MSNIFTSEKMRNMVAAAMLAFAGVASAADYVATPANNAEVTALNSIAVEFAGVTTVAETYSAFPTLSNAGGSNFRTGTSVSGNVYTIDVRETLAAGTYTLTIPANAITLDGAALDETISLNYTVASTSTGYTHMTVNPAEGRVAEVNAITVTLEGAKIASYIASGTESATHLTRNGENIATFMPYNTVIQGNTLTFTPYAPQTEGGEYKLVIPANSIAADGTPVEATTFTYTIFVPEVTATPTPGVVAALPKVDFTFAGVTELTENNYSGVSFTDAAGNAVRYRTSVSANVFSVTPIDAPAAGTYTVTVAPGTILCDGASYDREITATYTVAPDAPEFTATPSIANGSEVYGFSSMAITFEGVTSLASTIDATEKCPFITNAEGNRIRTITSVGIEGNVMTIAPYEAISEAGTYTLTVPGIGYTVNGAIGRDLTFTFTVKGANYTVTPAEAVSEISAMAFTFEGVTAVTEAAYDVMFRNAAGEAIRVRTSVEGNVYTVTPIDAVTVAGDYTLTIPANTLALDGAVYPVAIEKTFTVAAADYTVTPSIAEGASVYGFSSMALTFDGVTELASVIDATEKCPFITDAEGNRIRTITSVGIEGNVMTIAPYEAITEAGNYTLTVPGIGYTVHGAAGRDLTFNFTVKAVNIAVTPAEAVEALTAMTFTFEGVTAVEEVGYNVILRNAAGEAIRVRTSVEANVYTVTPIDAVSAAGEYTLTIPAGTLALDGAPYSAEIVRTFTVGAPAGEYTVVATPSTEADILALSAVTVTFEGATEVVSTIDDTPKCPYITDAEGNRLYTISKVAIEGNVMTIAPYEAIAKAGTYTLTIPGNDLTFTYNVIGFSYYTNPEPGEVKELEAIDFTFDNVKYVDEVGYSTYVIDAEGNQYRVLTGAKGSSYRVTLLDGAIKKSGEYTVVIPAGTLTLGKNVLDVEIRETFIVKAAAPAPTFTYTVSPANGAEVKELMTIDITLEGVETIELAYINPETAPVIWGLIDGNFYGYYTLSRLEGNTITFSRMSSFALPGVYNVVIPSGAFFADGAANEEIVLLYIVSENGGSGIEGVVIDAKSDSPVFNLQGVQVGTAAEAASLPHGIYVINGKKVRL